MVRADREGDPSYDSCSLVLSCLSSALILGGVIPYQNPLTLVEQVLSFTSEKTALQEDKFLGLIFPFDGESP